MRKLLLFQIGKRQFGLDLPLITNIQKARTFTEEVMETGETFVLTEEGARAPVIDLCVLFSGGISQAGERELILVSIESESLGLKVDHVLRVVAVEEDRIDSLPMVFGNPSLACFPRVLKHEDALILIMEPDGIRETWKISRQQIGEGADLTEEIVDAFEDELEIIELTEVVDKPEPGEIEEPLMESEADSLFPAEQQPVDLEKFYPETEPISGDELPPMEVILPEDLGPDVTQPDKTEPDSTLEIEEKQLEDLFTRMLRTRGISEMLCRIVRRMAEEAIQGKVTEIVREKTHISRQSQPKMAKLR